MYYRKSILSKVLDCQAMGLKGKIKALDALARNNESKLKEIDPLTRLILEAFRESENKAGTEEMLSYFIDQLTIAGKTLKDCPDVEEKKLKSIIFENERFLS